MFTASYTYLCGLDFLEVHEKPAQDTTARQCPFKRTHSDAKHGQAGHAMSLVSGGITQTTRYEFALEGLAICAAGM